MTSRRDERPRCKLLVVVPLLITGGTELHLLRVLSRLDKREFEVSVFATLGAGPLDARFRAAGIEVHLGQMGLSGRLRTLLSGFSLMRLLFRKRPDIVHFFLPAAYLIGGMVTLLTSPARRVMSRRSLNLYQSRWLVARVLEPWLHRRMHAVIGNCRAVNAQLQAEGAPPERLGLIPNGIDIARFAGGDRAEARAALDLPADALVLVKVATLLPYKGHADLVEALGSIRGELPEGWRLLVAGRDAGPGADLRARAEALDIAGHIRWLGDVEDVPPLLTASDIGLLCSHQEGFSNAVIEGMAAGLPMIVTDVGGCPEAVAHGSHGLVVPPRDPAALAAAILQLAADPRRRAAMGAAGRRRAAERYSIEACVTRYERLYRGLLAEPARSLAEILPPVDPKGAASRADTP